MMGRTINFLQHTNIILVMPNLFEFNKSNTALTDDELSLVWNV